MRELFSYEPVKKEDSRYRRPSKNVFLDANSHECANFAVGVAHSLGLRTDIFSYEGVLEEVGLADSMEVCARITGTSLNEQLKNILVADAALDGQNRPNAVLGIMPYPSRFDFKKMALVNAEYNANKRAVGQLAQRAEEFEKLGFTPGFIGVNTRIFYVPALFSPAAGEDFKPYTDLVPGLRIVDKSVQRLSKFCFLAGSRKADALVVVSHGDRREEPLGVKADDFFRDYFRGGNWYTMADIKEDERKTS